MSAIKSRVAVTGLALIIAYLALSAFVPVKTLIQFVTTLLISVSVAVVASYVPFLWRSAKQDDVSQSTHLVVGISGAWSHTAVLITWLVIWREGGRPDYMADSRFVAFWLFVGVCSGIAHLTAPRVLDDGRIPKRVWVLIGAVLGVGVFLAIIVLYRWIDPAWLAKRLAHL